MTIRYGARESGAGPLEGVVVADFSRVLAGPFATMMLGDLGADVVKVERPEVGDETRTWSPPVGQDGESTYFLAVNRNKHSLFLDFSTFPGRESARELALRADVVVENFAPGTMERYGLGWAELSAQRPDLVYASISGFGTAAGAGRPGYDFLIQAMGGLMSVTGPAGGDPTKVGVAVVDLLAGLNLTIGILAALRHRDRTGIGQRVEVDLLSCLLAGLLNQASAYLNAGMVAGRLGNAHPSIAPYQTLRTADRPLAVAVGNDRQFARLATAIGAPHLADDPRFATNPARVHHVAELEAELEARLLRQLAAHWEAVLGAAGVPCGPINSIAEAFDFAEELGLAPVVRLPREDGTVAASVANPVRLSATPVSYRTPPPLGPAASR